jgi:cell division transport system ATP-binding protein
LTPGREEAGARRRSSRADHRTLEQWRPALRFDGVSFSYGRVAALHEVSLSLWPGEIAYLVGPSGAGKTTLLRLAHGQLRPTAGCVLVAGVLVHRGRCRAIRRLRRTVGLVFQDYKLMARLTALDNVAYALRVADLGLPNRVARERAARALAEVGLDGRLHAYPGELSGGQQQRVAIARALAARPSVLLADEPTANLDIENAVNVTRLLARTAQRGAAVLVATCDDGVAMTDRAIRLIRGSIVDDRSPGRALCVVR